MLIGIVLTKSSSSNVFVFSCVQSKTWYNPQSHRRKYEETRVMLQLSSFKFNVAHQVRGKSKHRPLVA